MPSDIGLIGWSFKAIRSYLKNIIGSSICRCEDITDSQPNFRLHTRFSIALDVISCLKLCPKCLIQLQSMELPLRRFVFSLRVLKNLTEYTSNLDWWFRGDRENNSTLSRDWIRRCCRQSPLYLCPSFCNSPPRLIDPVWWCQFHRYLL